MRAFVQPPRGRPGTSRPAVAHHQDVVADRLDLREAVRDEDDADALGGQSPDRGEQAPDFRGGKSRRRLVEDQHARSASERAGNLDQLLAGGSQRACRCRDIQPAAKFRQHVGRPASGFRAVNETTSVAEFSAQKDVFPDRHVGRQAWMLMRDDNAQARGILRRGMAQRRARQMHLPAARRQLARDDAGQRALSRPVRS